MKINKKLFDSLTREPNEVQLVDGKKLEIFFMTEEEKTYFEAEGRFSIWTSDGKNYRFLVNEEFYNYGVIKEFYTQPVNAKWIDYVSRISKYQRKFLYALMLPIMALYIIVAILSIYLIPDYALYVLIGMMVLIFIVNAVQTRVVRTRMEEENDKTQLEIQEILTTEVYDQVAQDQIQFREMKNKAREAEFHAAQVSSVNSEVAEVEVQEEATEEVVAEVAVVEAAAHVEVKAVPQVEETPQVEEVSQVEKPAEPKRLTRKVLESKTIPELKDIARAHKISGFSNLNKQELVNLLYKNKVTELNKEN